MLSRELDGNPVYWTAAYRVGDLLIDTGCPRTQEELMAFLRGEGAPGGDAGDRPELKTVINTHAHEDHIGANSRLEESGLRLLAHPGAIPSIRRPPDIEPYRELAWGRAAPSRPEPIGHSVDVPPWTFAVIETPGHAPGHIALLERSRGWCFSSDLFVGVEFKVTRADESLFDMACSMLRLAAEPTQGGNLTLFTGIGQVFLDGRRSLVDCVARLARLAREARLLAAEGLDVPSIRDRLLGRESRLATLTGGHYSSERFVGHLLAPGFDELSV